MAVGAGACLQLLAGQVQAAGHNPGHIKRHLTTRAATMQLTAVDQTANLYHPKPSEHLPATTKKSK